MSDHHEPEAAAPAVSVPVPARLTDAALRRASADSLYAWARTLAEQKRRALAAAERASASRRWQRVIAEIERRVGEAAMIKPTTPAPDADPPPPPDGQGSGDEATTHYTHEATVAARVADAIEQCDAAITMSSWETEALAPLVVPRIVDDRPSSAWLHYACPAAAYSGGLRVREESGAAEEGREIHDLVAEAMRATERPAIDGDDPVASAARTCLCLLDEAERALRASGWAMTEDLHVEEPIEIRLPGATLRGTPDLWYAIDREDGREALALYDWKTGWADRDATAQLTMYAAGLLQLVPRASAVWCVPIRPRRRSWGPPIVVTRGAAERWLQDYYERVYYWDGETYTTGDHCSLCPRRWSCDARAAQLRAGAVAFLGAEPEALVARARELGPDTVLELRQRCGDIVRVAERVKALVREDVIDGGPIRAGERVLQSSESRRASVDVIAAWPTLTRVLSPDELAGAVKVSIGRVEAAAGERARLAGERVGAAKAAIRAELEAAGALRYETVTRVEERAWRAEEDDDE